MQNQGVAVVGMNINKTIIQLDTDIKGEGINLCNTIKSINVLNRRRGETVFFIGPESDHWLPLSSTQYKLNAVQ